MRGLLANRKIVIPAAVAIVLVVAAGLALFQPWKLFTSSTADDTLVSAQAPSSPGAGTLVGSGAFASLKHPTSGQAELVTLSDGNHVVQLRGFSTSDGPDVHVWLTDKSPDAGDKEFSKDGYFDLGSLKATNGNEVYQVPAGQDVSQFKSVLIWCKRFSVGFGAAGLAH